MLNRHHWLVKKMKRSGVCAVGTVTEITKKDCLPEEVRAILGTAEPSVVVTVSYKTQQNTDEVMLLSVSEKANNPYAVGETVAVRYLLENGHYVAIPEKDLHEAAVPHTSNTSEKSRQKISATDSFDKSEQKPEVMRILGTVLLALGVFAVSAGITVLIILWCFNQ